MELLLPSLGAMLPRLPVLIALAVAVVLAVLRWRRHPVVSGLVVTACALHALLMVVGTLVSIWLPLRLRDQGMGVSQLGMALGLSQGVLGVLSAAAWGLFIAAVFAERRREPAA